MKTFIITLLAFGAAFAAPTISTADSSCTNGAIITASNGRNYETRCGTISSYPTSGGTHRVHYDGPEAQNFAACVEYCASLDNCCVARYYISRDWRVNNSCETVQTQPGTTCSKDNAIVLGQDPNVTSAVYVEG